jgi:hypothetical protein
MVIANGCVTFGAVINEVLFESVSTPEFFSPLEECADYREAKAEYDSLYDEVFSGASVNAGQVQKLLNAQSRLNDAQAQFIYRTGIQAGISLSTPEFLTEGMII